jgi:hypothetical protein
MNGIPEPINKSFINVRYVSFGKFVLNTYFLKDNKLLIKYAKSHAPVPKLKSTPISNDFRTLINDLLSTQKINIDLQKQLNTKEQSLFQKLIQMAGLNQTLDYKPYVQNVDDYVRQFEVLRGGLLAGNQSPELKKDLIESINLLSNPSIGKIFPNDAIELIQILEEK